MKKTIIIINGSGGVGKDAFIKALDCVVSHNNICLHNISSVDQVKVFATSMGWDGSKDEKSRKFLSDLKDLWTAYNNGPIKDVVHKCDNIGENDNIIFIHCREPDQITLLKEIFEGEGKVCKTLLITRPIPIITSNHADANINNYIYDYTIANDGSLSDLDDKAKEFYLQII